MTYSSFAQSLGQSNQSSALGGAVGGASELTQGAGGLMSMYGNSGQALGAATGASSNGQAQGNALASSTSGNQAFANQALANGFNSNNALYNTELQNITDQTRAAEAARGISTTPYGAGVESNTLMNFNQQWQQQQIQNQATAAGTASTLEGANTAAVSAGGSLANQSAMLPTQALSQLMSAGASAQNANTSAISAGVQGFLSYLSTASGIQGSGVKATTNLSNYSDYESQFKQGASTNAYGGSGG